METLSEHCVWIRSSVVVLRQKWNVIHDNEPGEDLTLDKKGPACRQQ
jgi:hypothetical protein